LVTRFGAAPTLLILDNLEQLVGAASVLAELLDRIPNLGLLATSQVELGLADEYRVRLGELSEAAAVELFEDRGRFAHPGLELTDEDRRVLGLAARRLDYLPLAIELAAARLSVLTPAQLNQRLAASTGLVRGRSKDPLARHGSLRDTIAWTASLLDEAARRTFLAMSMFARPATLEAVATGGPDVLYGGEIGEAYAAGLRRSGSPISIEETLSKRFEHRRIRHLGICGRRGTCPGHNQKQNRGFALDAKDRAAQPPGI
jgi:predicted ATPase